MTLHLATIPLHLPFLDTLAARWLAAHAAPDRGCILLPTRRAARALATAFLNANGGRPMILPRILALGAVDEAPLGLGEGFDLPPAIGALPRNALLARMILALPPERGGARSIDQAWLLAAELARLLDEADRAELDLAAALAGAAAAEHALHWQTTLQFMDIVTRALPAVLADMGVMNPVARQVRLLGLQAAQWQAAPPPEPVWAAGLTGAIPAVARLMRVVAGLSDGMVVLPGLDQAMPEPAWEAMDDSHPQAGLARLLADMSVRRGDVSLWDGTPMIAPARVEMLATALLPAEALEAWRARLDPDIAGLFRLPAANQQEEAVAVAMVLRHAIQTPHRRAALVTPDRDLATRVSAELLRWGVLADDSAGEPLAAAPPAVFLRLLARAAVEDFAPVALLALLKHPYAAAGLAPATCREAARSLESSSLRGPSPPPGMTGLKRLADQAPAAARDLVYRLEAALAPLLGVMAGLAVAPADALAALAAAAEALAGTAEVEGAERLWAGPDGDALATLLASAAEAVAGLPDLRPRELPVLLDALLSGAVLRGGRALRGRAATEEHPRVFIWGLLEARLQSADLIVLGGLTEGVWPPATDPGPWMSRPMRAQAGLPSPELSTGQAAHDFVATACAAPVVVLSGPARRENAPAVPSRWLARIAALLDGQAMALPVHPAAAWVRLLDLPAAPPAPLPPPRPCPPVALRPRRLSVTEIETLLADPYAIYARHILRLRRLDPLEQSTDAADYGALVHAALHRFLGQVGARLPADSRRRLRAAMDAELLAAGLRAALVAWWRPRLHRIADWVIDQEVLRRQAIAPIRIASEASGEWTLPTARGFALAGRADRLEFRADGSVAIIDYKTGTPPTQSAVEAGFAPQLPLEAAMVEAGAFGPAMHGQVAALTYWQLGGGATPGTAHSLYKSDTAAIAQATAEARANLVALIDAYDDPARAYLAQPHPGRPPRFPQYAQLARIVEWDLSGQDG